MGIYTTEITSEKIVSDNPIHQRLLKAYFLAKDYVHGNLLEIGCGEGRGFKELISLCSSYTAIEKIASLIESLKKNYPSINFIHANIPPLAGIKNNQFDIVISFQVIEHIKNDKLFLEEIYRVLNPGGKALLTTPNFKKTLTRNPWHIKEYSADQLRDLANSIFDRVEVKGITGNDKVWQYYEMNKRSVEKITRFDIFNLQHNLPSALLKIPYEILNRINRNNLKKSDNKLVGNITHLDYLLSDDPDSSLDLFLMVEKKG